MCASPGRAAGCIVSIVAGLFITAAPQRASADIITYDVTGNIDTGDQLIIQGSTMQWFHDNTGGAAVGRHLGNNFPTVISTSLNGITQMTAVQWTPTWPNPVPDEIRFVASSSTFTSLTPILPSAPVSVTTSVVSGRGSLSLVQSPSAANDYKLIVRYADGFNGSADLDGLITITTPEPASLAVLGAASLLLLRRRGKFIPDA